MLNVKKLYLNKWPSEKFLQKIKWTIDTQFKSIFHQKQSTAYSLICFAHFLCSSTCRNPIAYTHTHTHTALANKQTPWLWHAALGGAAIKRIRKRLENSATFCCFVLLCSLLGCFVCINEHSMLTIGKM